MSGLTPAPSLSFITLLSQMNMGSNTTSSTTSAESRDLTAQVKAQAKRCLPAPVTTDSSSMPMRQASIKRIKTEPAEMPSLALESNEPSFEKVNQSAAKVIQLVTPEPASDFIYEFGLLPEQPGFSEEVPPIYKKTPLYQKHFKNGIKEIRSEEDISLFVKILQAEGLGNGITLIECTQNQNYEQVLGSLPLKTTALAIGSGDRTVYEVDATRVAKRTSPGKKVKKNGEIAFEGVQDALVTDNEINIFLTIKRFEKAMASKHPLTKANFPNVNLVLRLKNEKGVTQRSMIIMSNFGKDLFDTYLVEKPDFSFDKFKGILLRNLQGVAFLHALGIAHKDLKPENVFEKGLADFGLSAFLKPGQLLNDTAGSIGHLSPEMLFDTINPKMRKEGHDHRVDLWSLCVTFFEVYAAQRLFDIRKAPVDIEKAPVDIEKAPKDTISEEFNYLILISERLGFSPKELYEICSPAKREMFFEVDKSNGEVSFAMLHQVYNYKRNCYERRIKRNYHHYNEYTGYYDLKRGSKKYIRYQLKQKYHIQVYQVEGTTQRIWAKQETPQSEPKEIYGDKLQRKISKILSDENKLFTRFSTQIKEVAEKRKHPPEKVDQFIDFLRKGLRLKVEERVEAEKLLQEHVLFRERLSPVSEKKEARKAASETASQVGERSGHASRAQQPASSYKSPTQVRSVSKPHKK